MTAPSRSRLSRRHLLQSVALGVFAAALPKSAIAIEPFSRSGPPRFRLALAAYSFRDDFKPKAGNEAKLDMFKFIDYCADHGCDGAELTSYYFPENVTLEFLARVRRHAHLKGISVSGTAVGNTFTYPPGPDHDKEIAQVKLWIDRASVLGAPHIRVFAGNARPGQSRADAVKNCVASLEECGAYAGERGIWLGIENHGGIVATPAELLEIVRAVKSPWVGVNLDTGNFHTADPYAGLAECAPYSVNVQFKAEIQRQGAKAKEMAEIPRVMKILRDSGYQGWVALEFEMNQDPWQKVPELLDALRKSMQ